MNESTKGGQLRRDRATRALAVAGRQRDALAARLAGMSYEAIAEHLGYADKSGAFRACMAAIKALPVENAEQVRSLELARLDRMLAAVWPNVIRGISSAVHAALAVEERRCRLLGMDAPSRVDVEQRVVAIAISEGIDPDEARATFRQMLKEGF